jgi:hypothetical protein
MVKDEGGMMKGELLKPKQNKFSQPGGLCEG